MCITFWYSLNILIIRRNQSDELLKYLQSGSTLYFEAIKNLRRLGWSRAQLIYDYNHDFQSQASFQTFCIFEIRPQYSEKCFFMIQSTVSIFSKVFSTQKLWWHLAENCVTNSLERRREPPPNFFLKLIFELAWNVIHHVNCIKKHITLEILSRFWSLRVGKRWWITVCP